MLEQLYLTGRDNGSGFADYRLNALSPGVGAETQRDVVGLVGYRPPRSQAFPAGPDELRRCPVNLSFRPGAASEPQAARGPGALSEPEAAGGVGVLSVPNTPGPRSVLANVEYLGPNPVGGLADPAPFADPGAFHSPATTLSFFAHALVAASNADVAEALDGLLPIETWRSPVWVRRQPPETVLRPLDRALPRGGVTPATVRAFLAEHPLADRLPVLVTAVAAAQAGWGPPVLLIESDSDRAALWIGAVSYLLPPRAGRTLAFTTYTANPGAAPWAHLIGTVSEAAAELPLDLVHAFELFDMPAGRVPDGPTLAVASVAARVGVGTARALWYAAESLAEPDTPFDAWYGPLSASAALKGVRLTASEDRAVADWAARNAERLDPSAANDLAVKLDEQPQWRGEEYLPTLFDLAWRGRNLALCDEIRIRQIDFELARIRDGDPTASAAVRIESPRVRMRVAARIRELLESAPVGSSAGVLRLLDWTRRSGLAMELEPGFLVDLTRWVLAPEVMSGRWSAGDDDPLRVMVRDWPAIRQSFVTFLQGLAAEGTQNLDTALDGPLGAFLRSIPAFEVEPPALQEALWISRARQDPSQQIPVLRAVLDRRAIRLPDAELLSRIWPHGWSPEAMVHVAAATPLEELDDEPVAHWFLDTLAMASTPDDIAWYVTVARRLLASPAAHRLEAQCVPLAKAVELDRRCHEVRDFKDLEWIARQDSAATPMIAVMVAALLPDLLLAASLDPDQVCSVLELMYPDVMRVFLAKVQTPPLDRTDAGLMRIAGIYVLAETRYQYDQQLRAELIGCVEQAADELGESGWGRLRNLILASKRQVEDEFLTFEESRQAPRSWFPFGNRRRG